ncbi:RDD family protein [Ochrobactrum sp. Marseille-Q0166]|uniref:RDD family protein n=1 Tax=Ochrobactrum sp. Marseille-Q0166 TaxID=2761105 RepID=UPI0016559992|nr:RDD family protein [Ochrobactrum sp. Marseille-Q0166]MBC8717698.1 RDD family protein [Ochrobactrum sp. Marseille-Q0166]
MSDNILHGEVIGPHYESRAFFEGVRTRRIMAFLIDYVIVFLLCIPAAIVIFILGILTLSLGWALYAIMFPVVALFYVSRTLGGPQQATKGMQMMNIKMVRLEGGTIDPMLAVAHTVLFWGLNVVLTPLILLATLVIDRKRTVHDLLLGTAVIRSDR